MEHVHMKRTRLLASSALAGLLAAGGLLPLGLHGVSHAAQRASGPTRGGTVIDGLYEEPDKLIPNTSTETFGRMVQKTIYSPLFYSDDKSVLHAGLASELPSTSNGGITNGGKTYTFRLRPGLVWSDGQPLDARDVDYSWRTWMNKDMIVAGTIGFDQIKSATVSKDKLSITFQLKGPYSPFVSAWTDDIYPMPAHIFSKYSAKALNTSPFIFKPTVSSGPFMIQSRKAGDNITEVRNPRYYEAGKPYLDKLIFKIIPDQVALTNALQAHEVDCAWFLSIANIKTLQSISGYKFVAPTAPNIEQGLLNLHNPILQDIRVRQALEYGLNRQAMVSDVWHGNAVLMASDEAPSLFSYTPSVKPFPFDPNKARQLLDAAGWKMQGSVRMKNGKPLSLRWSTTARNAWRAQDEAIAQQSFSDIGVQLRIVNYPADTYFGQVLPKGDFDIGEFENNFAYDPGLVVAQYFSSTQFAPRGSNYGFYGSATYDALIHQQEQTTDVQQRKTIFAKMQQVMNHDVPALWLYDPPNLAEYNVKLHNYAPGPFSNETWNTADWYKS